MTETANKIYTIYKTQVAQNFRSKPLFLIAERGFEPLTFGL